MIALLEAPPVSIGEAISVVVTVGSKLHSTFGIGDISSYSDFRRSSRPTCFESSDLRKEDDVQTKVFVSRRLIRL